MSPGRGTHHLGEEDGHQQEGGADGGFVPDDGMSWIGDDAGSVSGGKPREALTWRDGVKSLLLLRLLEMKSKLVHSTGLRTLGVGHPLPAPQSHTLKPYKIQTERAEPHRS